MKYSNQQYKLHTFETCKEYIKSTEVLGNMVWGVFCQKSHVLVGTFSATQSEPGNYDLGIMVGAEYSNRRLGFEIWSEMSNILIKIDDVQLLTAGCYQEHTAMKKLLLSTKYEYVEDGCEVIGAIKRPTFRFQRKKLL